MAGMGRTGSKIGGCRSWKDSGCALDVAEDWATVGWSPARSQWRSSVNGGTE